MEGLKKHATIGNYILLRTLGTGYNSKVKLAFNPMIKQYFAVKIIKHSHPSLNLKNIHKEIAVLSNLHHPHIVNLIEYMESVEYFKKTGEKYNVLAIVMELVPGGELFEYVANSGRFTEKVARTYFHQLIETLEYCHGRGITHRDLKPENLLFDKDFNLKIADFGFATLILGNHGDGQLYTILGTPSYMAPELHLKQPYSGPAADLFAAAIILFIMISGTPPFAQATQTDPHYRLICLNRVETFWAAHSRGKPPGFYSADFKNLMNSLLAPDPSQRLSLAEIKTHPWYKCETSDIKDIQKEFLQRKKAVDDELRKQREAKQKQKEMEKLNEQNAYGDNVFKGIKPFKGRDLETDMNEAISKVKFAPEFGLDSKRQIKEYDPNGPCKLHTEMFLVISPDLLLKYLISLSLFIFSDIIISKDTYKIKGKYVGNFHRLELDIAILKVDEQTYAIDFKKRSGDNIQFLKIIEENFRQPIDKLRNQNQDKANIVDSTKQ